MFTAMFAQGNSVASWFGELLELGPLVLGAMLIIVLAMTIIWLTVRVIPNDRAAVVEKLWSANGSVAEGRIIALNGEAGYQAELLRGGVHFRLLALAISHSQSAAGHRRAGQDRIRVRPRWRTAAARAKRWAASCRATTFKTPAGS